MSCAAPTATGLRLDLAKEQSSENPVYYVQYAHARICSILRQAETVPSAAQVNCSLLIDPAQLTLIRKIAELPVEIAYAAIHQEPHRLAFYANELATLFHGFYTTCRVLSDQHNLSQARLALTNACRITLRNTLRLVGVAAPEKM